MKFLCGLWILIAPAFTWALHLSYVGETSSLPVISDNNFSSKTATELLVFAVEES